jgi:hypothetical protein
MDAVAGTCFGFGVRTELPFRFLRDGDGPALAVTESADQPTEAETRPILEWHVTNDGVFHARLYEQEGCFRLWVEGSGSYVIDPSVPSISLPPNGNPVKREARLWAIPAVLCFLARGDIALHAAAVETHDGAVLLAAPGTFGKTTLAAAFLQAGYRILSEDLSCIRLHDEQAVVPGPAMLRVRRDMAGRLELGGERRLDGGDERVYFALEGRRGDGTPVPLRAVVFLRESEDGINLERVDPARALPDLWALSFALPTPRDRARCFGALTDLAHRVPIWNLARPLRLTELERTVERLVASV